MKLKRRAYPHWSQAGCNHAFTFVELLVVLGVLGFLTLLLIPALARTQTNSSAGQCLNNHRQLMRAWQMYAGDNDEKLPGKKHGTTIVANDANAPWVQGWLDWGTSHNNTNLVILTDERYASLAKYVGRSATVFKCPADRYGSPVQLTLGRIYRTRSVSMNQYVGGAESSALPGTAYREYAKVTDITKPAPASLFVFVDEHPDSINDPTLLTTMGSATANWIDLPASYHDGACTYSFADGHVELRQWKGNLVRKPVTFSYAVPSGSEPEDLADYQWHTARTTVLK
jgi:prepilin-type processing-associated H-X9-DG protein